MLSSAHKLMKNLAVAIAAAGFVIAGLVLLLRALWIVLAGALGAMWSHVILGGSLLVIGLLIVWWIAAHNRGPAIQPWKRDQIVDLVLAFLEGLEAGRAARRDRD